MCLTSDLHHGARAASVLRSPSADPPSDRRNTSSLPLGTFTVTTLTLCSPSAGGGGAASPRWQAHSALPDFALSELELDFRLPSVLTHWHCPNRLRIFCQLSQNMYRGRTTSPLCYTHLLLFIGFAPAPSGKYPAHTHIAKQNSQHATPGTALNTNRTHRRNAHSITDLTQNPPFPDQNSIARPHLPRHQISKLNALCTFFLLFCFQNKTLTSFSTVIQLFVQAAISPKPVSILFPSKSSETASSQMFRHFC